VQLQKMFRDQAEKHRLQESPSWHMLTCTRSSHQRFEDAAVQDFLMSARIIRGADDRSFIVEKSGATRAPSASVQTLQDQYGKDLVEVLKAVIFAVWVGRHTL
jgi:hypothetical protein